MQKKFIYLLLATPLMLASCANETNNGQTDGSSTNSEIEEIITSINIENAPTFFKQNLAKLKVGYHYDSLIKQTAYATNNPADKDVTISNVETFVIQDKFSYKLYNPTPNHDKSNLGAFETFYKGDDGLTYSARINLNNQLAKRKVLHPTGNGVFNYSNEGFENMFKDLSFEDFTMLSSFDYTLNLNKVRKPNLKEAIASSLYAGPGLKAKTFSIKLTPDAKIKVKSNLETFIGHSVTYEYQIESTLTPIKVDEFPDRNILYPEVEDELFTSKINQLKQYNFTLTQQDFNANGDVIKESKLLMNPDKFYSQTKDTLGRPMNVGMYKDGENYFGVVKQDNGEYILGDKVSEEIFYYYVPSFKISRAVFDKLEDGTYKLKPQIDSDSTPFSRYETDADEQNRTEIKFLDSTIEVTNSFGKYSTKIVYSDIGTTDVGYSKDSVIKTPINLTSWDQVLNENQIAKLTKFIGGDISNVPFPTMLKDATSFALGIATDESTLQIVYTSAAIPSKPSDIKAYNDLLATKGWEAMEGSNDEKGYYKKVISEQEYQAIIESDGANFYMSFFKIA